MNKKLWLDLEIREDIDDYLTLIYALENNYNVSVVSIHNPSFLELSLVNSVLTKFNRKDISIVANGNITNYDEGRDINPVFLPKTDLISDMSFSYLEDFIPSIDIKDMIIFCGGSLNTLAKLTKYFKTDTFEAYIQGGFASYELVGKENTLKKFKNRDKVPTWNLNLDIEATKVVLESGVKAHFISKNICHDSFISVEDFKKSDSIVAKNAIEYFEFNNKKSKCMHDLLAFISIDSDIVSFKPVVLKYTNNERVKWWAEYMKGSNYSISVSFDKEGFLNKILKV